VQAAGAYARAVPPGQPNSAAFVSLTNKSDADHALVAAESSASKVVELHTHLLEEGMMKMRPVAKIDLPAGETVELQPGGLHLMLMELRGPLEKGSHFPLTLVFEKAGAMTVDVTVMAAGSMGPDAGKGAGKADAHSHGNSHDHGTMKH